MRASSVGESRGQRLDPDLGGTTRQRLDCSEGLGLLLQVGLRRAAAGQTPAPPGWCNILDHRASGGACPHRAGPWTAPRTAVSAYQSRLLQASTPACPDAPAGTHIFSREGTRIRCWSRPVRGGPAGPWPGVAFQRQRGCPWARARTRCTAAGPGCRNRRRASGRPPAGRCRRARRPGQPSTTLGVDAAVGRNRGLEARWSVSTTMPRCAASFSSDQGPSPRMPARGPLETSTRVMPSRLSVKIWRSGATAKTPIEPVMVPWWTRISGAAQPRVSSRRWQGHRARTAPLPASWPPGA